MSKKKRREKHERRKERRGAIKGKITSAALKPFKKPMLRILKSRGVKGVSDHTPVSSIALLFYNNVVRHSAKDHFEGDCYEIDKMIFNRSIHGFDSLDEAAASAAAATTIAAGAALAAPTGGISLIIAPLVAAILKWFGSKKKELEEGAILPEDEKEAVAEAEENIRSAPSDNKPISFRLTIAQKEKVKEMMNPMQKLFYTLGLLNIEKFALKHASEDDLAVS